MPTAVILGSGTSNGVPMLGWKYPPGYLDHPKNHRTRCSAVLQGPSGNLLIDCTPELRLQMTREGIYDVEAVVITHTHADHVMGMDDLRSICILSGQPMPVYTLPRYHDDIRRIFRYAFEDIPPGLHVPRFDLRTVDQTLEVGGMQIETFVVNHGSVPVIGIRSGGFCYLTDVKVIPPEAERYLDGLDTLVIDAVRLAPHPNHMNLEESLATIARFRPKQAYLTHLSHDYDHDRTSAELPAGVALAYDGLRIDF